MAELAPLDSAPRGEGQQLQGTLKVWNLDKGYGFIACTDGGTDLFVHQSAISVEGDRYRAILPGTEVKFVFFLREGKETAREVTSLTDTPLPGFASKLEASQKLSVTEGRPGMFTGTVKFMNKEKGFGFIIPDAGGEDMFVHVGDIEGQQLLNQGEPVSYTTAVKKGVRPQAVDVCSLRARSAFPQQQSQSYPGGPSSYQPSGYPSPYGAPPPPAPYDPYSPYGAPAASPYGAPAQRGLGGAVGASSGTIKWFNEEKGFGFIVPGNGGTDVYFKGSDVQGGGAPLAEAEPVTYETKSAPDGKIWASCISRRAGGKRKASLEGPDGAFKRAAPGGPAPMAARPAPTGYPQQYPGSPPFGSQGQYGSQPPQYAQAQYGAQPPASQAPYSSSPQYAPPAAPASSQYDQPYYRQ